MLTHKNKLNTLITLSFFSLYITAFPQENSEIILNENSRENTLGIHKPSNSGTPNNIINSKPSKPLTTPKPKVEVIKITPETGLGDSSKIDNYILAKDLEGRDVKVISSNNLYEVSNHIDNQGNLDLTLTRNSDVKISDSLPGKSKEIANNINLTEAILDKDSSLNNEDSNLSDYLLDSYEEGILDGIIENNFQPKSYTSLSTQILNATDELQGLHEDSIFSTSSSLSGKFIDSAEGSGRLTLKNIKKIGDYNLNLSFLYKKDKTDFTKDGKYLSKEDKVGSSISLTKRDKNKLRGFSLGYLNNDYNIIDGVDKGSLDRFDLKLSEQYKLGKYNLFYSLGGGINSHKSERKLDFLVPSRKATSKFKSYDISTSFDVSRAFSLKKLILAPYVGVDASYISREKIKEKGAGSLNAILPKTESFSLRPKVGLQNEIELFSFDSFGHQRLFFNFGTEYSAELGNFATKKEAVSLEGFDGTFLLGNPVNNRDKLTYNASLVYDISNFEISAGYEDGEKTQGRNTFGIRYNWN